MKRGIALILALLLTLAGCGSRQPETTASAEDSGPKQVGICMPREEGRWIQEAEEMKSQLEALGYGVRIFYGESDPRLQADQLRALAREKVACIILAAVDSALLTQEEQQAKAAGCKLIAYDRLLMDTDAVACFVGYDSLGMGRAVAQRIVQQKRLDTAGEQGEQHTIEFFMGAPEDHNAFLFHRGVMEVLGPYLDGGELVCRTGRTAFEDTCVVDWSAELAQQSCGGYLGEYYPGETPDILCAASDDLALGCIRALEVLEAPAAQWPYVTGCGGENSEVLEDGRQALTVETYPRVLVKRCVEAADALLRGEDPPVNDTESCHNNVMAVPAYLCSFLVKEGKYPPKAPSAEKTENSEGVGETPAPSLFFSVLSRIRHNA